MAASDNKVSTLTKWSHRLVHASEKKCDRTIDIQVTLNKKIPQVSHMLIAIKRNI